MFSNQEISRLTPIEKSFKAAFELLSSFPELTLNLKPNLCICQNNCVINSLIDLTLTPNISKLQKFTTSVKIYFKKVGQYEEEDTLIDPIDILGAVLVNFHSLETTRRCFQDNEQQSLDCRGRCLLHRFFHLGVKEIYTCQCGMRTENPWDDTNICQFYNISDSFDNLDREIIQRLAFKPKKLLVKENQAISSSFLNLINKKLRDRLEGATTETCGNDECEVKMSNVTFEVTNAPKFYIIDIIWDQENETIGAFESFLATVAVKRSFELKEIYMNGFSNLYNLHSIIFNRENFFKIAFLKENGWNFEGIYQGATWDVLLSEITFLRLHPVAVVYVQGGNGSQFELDLKKMIKLEQVASQCDLSKEFNLLNPQETSTGLFKEAKRPLEVQNPEKSPVSLLRNEKVLENKDSSNSSLGKDLIVKEKNEGSRAQQDFPTQPLLPKNERIQEDIILREYQKDQALEVKRNQPKDDERKYEKEINPLNQPKANQTDQGDTWNCSCGIKNQNYSHMCIRCRKPRENQSINTWTCKKCKIINNDQNSYSCSECYSVDVERYDLISKNVIKPTTKGAHPEQKTAEKKVNPPKDEVIVEIWECKCGQSNMPDYNICIKCENLKPGLKGWVCNTCKVLNEEYSYKCSACSNYKDSALVKPQEFWLCEKCNTAIVKGINFCESCGFIKLERENKKAGNVFDEDRYAICSNCDKQTLKYSGKCMWCQSKLNDQLREEKKNEEKDEYLNRSDEKFWTCGKCNELNASLRTYCSKCFEDKKKHEIRAKPRGVYEEKAEENNPNKNWKCWKCKIENTYNAIRCAYCKSMKIEAEIEKPKQNFEEIVDTVKCRYCNRMTDSSKGKCEYCKKNIIITGSSKDSSSKGYTNSENSDWICGVCRISNSLNRKFCSKCYEYKDKVAVTSAGTEQNPGNRKCTSCRKEIKLVICSCGNTVRIISSKCIHCNSDTTGINKCSDCSSQNIHERGNRLEYQNKKYY